MSEMEVDHERLGLRDGEYVAKLMPVLRMVVKLWYRSEVSGIENVPDGGVLLVSNHSGGLVAMDVPVIAVAFHDTFGPDRLELAASGHSDRIETKLRTSTIADIDLPVKLWTVIDATKGWFKVSDDQLLKA